MILLVYGGRGFGVVPRIKVPEEYRRQCARATLEFLRFERAIAIIDQHPEVFAPKTPNAYSSIHQIIEGGAKGADRLGQAWGYRIDPTGQMIRTFQANWTLHGNAAGPIRNEEMLKYLVEERTAGADVAALQCPGGVGTADMRSRLEKALIVVHDLSVDVGCSCHPKAFEL